MATIYNLAMIASQQREPPLVGGFFLFANHSLGEQAL
jgi:hypothetical protein